MAHIVKPPFVKSRTARHPIPPALVVPHVLRLEGQETGRDSLRVDDPMEVGQQRRPQPTAVLTGIGGQELERPVGRRQGRRGQVVHGVEERAEELARSQRRMSCRRGAARIGAALRSARRLRPGRRRVRVSREGQPADRPPHPRPAPGRRRDTRGRSGRRTAPTSSRARVRPGRDRRTPDPTGTRGR